MSLHYEACTSAPGTHAIILLEKHAPNRRAFQGVLAHSLAVSMLASEMAAHIAEKAGKSIDMRLLVSGAILHDIGRYQYPPGRKNSILHGWAGGRILRQENMNHHAIIAERHIGAGISDKEAKKLGMPAGEYMPVSIEEKIIAHADNLVFYTRRGSISEVIRRFSRESGADSVFLLKQLHQELCALGAFRGYSPE